jgi:hypothetical protein
LSVARYNESPKKHKWEICLIVGPFTKRTTEFKTQWQARSRKLSGRIRFGAALAADFMKRYGFKLKVYSPNNH